MKAKRRIREMIIRRAKTADMDGLNKLLMQVLMVHHNGRPDLFKSHAKKYTDEEVFSMYKQCPYSGWIKEGIIAGVQKEFGIGYCFNSDRVVIPHRFWETGEIIGLIGRTLKSNIEIEMFDIPKYFPIIP